MILILMFLAFICISIAFNSIQNKKIDTYMKDLEKELLEELNIIK
ncbi:MAG: hypothetical protein E6845_07680 [Clostridium sp.]|nr:hypothetical protein [Clostridium sp.]MDU1602831.1 hypothetical protein [Clostridium sp.]